MDSGFGLDVFRAGRVELVQDFPEFDCNGDGKVDDNDLLFAVTHPQRPPGDGHSAAQLRQQPHGALRAGRLDALRSNLTVNVGLR